MVGSC